MKQETPKASLKFFIPSGIVDSREFKEKKGTYHGGCGEWSPTGAGFIQYSHEFLHLQPSSFISDDLLRYLNENATRVVLQIPAVPNEKVIKGLRPKDSTIQANQEKEFSIQLGKRRISGMNCQIQSSSFDLIFEGKSSKDVFETFHSFAPGYFPQSSFIPITHFLSGMNFFRRLRLVFGK
ncbi:MAG: hypothetical protein KBB86_00045 [Candidatus Pacebacteria bacterium]|nr:hypothetical protein [Candidatus Paceibacterota bacterium]